MDRPLFDPTRITGPARPSKPDPDALWTVSQLTQRIKRTLTDHLPPTLHVVGEISNIKRHSSGHVYFTLKDAHAELACVLWRSAAGTLKFKPENGLEVIATGQIDVFERAGRYQLYVRKLEPRGLGALELAFRQLCEKLQAEGLFDPKHKKPLPRYPRRIAVVTSPTGAAVRDILRTLHRRYPCAEVCVFPVAVQGPAAAVEIARAIRRIDAHHRQIGGVDVLIVGRGGGSLEDLWAFNEEPVARAVFACRIPVVSAVGHEVDVTISDLVADVRAATPTAAAELVAPDVTDVLHTIRQWHSRLTRDIGHAVSLAGATLHATIQRPPFREPLEAVRRREQIIDDLAARMTRHLADRLHEVHRRVARGEVAVQRMHPRSFLAETSRRLADADHAVRWALSQVMGRRERDLARRAQELIATRPDGRIALLADRVERFGRRAADALVHRTELAGARVRSIEERLQATSHRATLARGFTITRLRKGRRLVRDVSDVRPGDRLVTETVGGEIESTVADTNQMELFE
ncbi:MAG: exodeoxyribonuclease VII large subunit [Phycisphaerae bacterium]|nr:exodeoxyribonuclease VII large subunit [Phycisphaerae bacterium]